MSLRHFSLALTLFIFMTASRMGVAGEFYDAEGELVRYYGKKSRTFDWSSYVVVKDSLNQDERFFVHPHQTLILRGAEVLKPIDLVGGMRLTVLYRKNSDGNLYASVIQVSG